MSATASIILDTRRMKIKTKKFPIKLQVSFDRVTLHYQTIFDLSKDDYGKLSSPRIGSELQSIRQKLKYIQRESEEFIRDMDGFSFYEFERDFIIDHELFVPRKKLKEPEQAFKRKDEFDYSPFKTYFPIFDENHSIPGTISGVYFQYIKMLLQQKRIGTARTFQDSYNSIKKFRGNMLFTEITVNFLVQYEQWMLEKGRARATVGIKLRPLRTIFNEAIDDLKIIKREKHYPFGRRRYQIPTGRNLKKALKQEQISAIYYDQPDCPEERKAKDFWIFFYLANGMNPKDVAYLKVKNIQGDFLVFIRAKTERTSRHEPKPITVFILDDMWDIIDRWGNKKGKPNNYLFPILEPGLNAMDEFLTVRKFTKFVNDNMLKVCKRLRFDRKVTTIVSRHSFSTQLKRAGASTEFIQEALGHTDKKTTENYLDSFEQEIKKSFSLYLTAFKQTK
jgi:integrase